MHPNEYKGSGVLIFSLHDTRQMSKDTALTSDISTGAKNHPAKHSSKEDGRTGSPSCESLSTRVCDRLKWAGPHPILRRYYGVDSALGYAHRMEDHTGEKVPPHRRFYDIDDRARPIWLVLPAIGGGVFTFVWSAGFTDQPTAFLCWLVAAVFSVPIALFMVCR